MLLHIAVLQFKPYKVRVVFWFFRRGFGKEKPYPVVFFCTIIGQLTLNSGRRTVGLFCAALRRRARDRYVHLLTEREERIHVYTRSGIS